MAIAIERKLKRRIYFEAQVSPTREDKKMQVSEIEYGAVRAVEIRDFVKVPKGIGEESDWHPSTGYIFDMGRLAEVIDALTSIQRTHKRRVTGGDV